MADSAGPEEIGTPFATPGRPEIDSALSGTPNTQIRDSADLGHDIIATAVPIQEEGDIVGAVRITKNVQQVNDNVRNVTLGLIAIGVAGLVAGLLLAFGLAGSLSRPLTRLAETAKDLGEGDLSARAGEVRGPREIEELGRSFDEMAAAGRALGPGPARVRRERLAPAPHAAHGDEAPDRGRDRRRRPRRDPRATARRRPGGRPPLRDRRPVARHGARDRGGQPPRGSTWRMPLARAVDRWAERAAQRHSSLELHGEGGSARADATDLDQIFDNLIDNATSYAPGEVDRSRPRVRNGRVIVAVRDRGNGIPSGRGRAGHRTLLPGQGGAGGRLRARTRDRPPARREVGRDARPSRAPRARGRGSRSRSSRLPGVSFTCS